MDDDDLLDLFAGMALINLAGRDIIDEVIAARCYNIAEKMIEEKRKRNERKKNRPE